MSGAIAEAGHFAWRETEVPDSGIGPPWEPDKDDIRHFVDTVDEQNELILAQLALLGLNQSSGVIYRLTVDDLEAYPTDGLAVGQPAYVIADPDGDVEDGNGIWIFNGTSFDWADYLPDRQKRLRLVTGVGDVTVSATEAGIVLKRTIEDDTAVTLPSAAVRLAAGAGDITIKDGLGNAGTHPFYLSGVTIDNVAGTFRVARNWACIVLRPLEDGSGYVIVSKSA